MPYVGPIPYRAVKSGPGHPTGPVRLTKLQLREIFEKFDINNDMRLSKAELKEAFDYLGAVFPGHRAGRAINHTDDNGDGFIDFQELDDLVEYANKRGYAVN